ncbi:MAG: hypothetical protein CMN55_07940 [Sneathiella sp.]|jgi:N-acetylglucosamine kinase-like BadF-type ATPase|uniref:hypothetical protein n=1 Tax=Sneathiella sp. TaxID=1964365 RepID=UPI000C67B2E7|nr:hypothetical protein [Sneathiella sp.]MAL79032.1 hypothetical protein [Sneathiella sp.]
MDYDAEFDDDLPDIEDYPTLRSVVRFNKLIPAVAWFSAIGEPLARSVFPIARAYMDTLGFPAAYVAEVADWEDAAYAAANPEFNSDWWEAEEQLRMALTDAALELMSEEDLTLALTHVSATASKVITDAFEAVTDDAGIDDQELVRAAIGSAVQACHQAALVLAAGEEDDHPFALKYRLYEQGHWPIALTGGSFHIF